MTKNNLIWKKFKFLLEKNEAYRAESENRVNDKTVCSFGEEE